MLYDYAPYYNVTLTWTDTLKSLPAHRAAVGVLLITLNVVAKWGVKYWTLQYRTWPHICSWHVDIQINTCNEPKSFNHLSPFSGPMFYKRYTYLTVARHCNAKNNHILKCGVAMCHKIHRNCQLSKPECIIHTTVKKHTWCIFVCVVHTRAIAMWTILSCPCHYLFSPATQAIFICAVWVRREFVCKEVRIIAMDIMRLRCLINQQFNYKSIKVQKQILVKGAK